MQALEARVAKLEVQVQTSVSRSLNKHVNQVTSESRGFCCCLMEVVGTPGAYHANVILFRPFG